MLNLGNITFGISADLSGLDAAQRRLEAYGQRVDTAMSKSAKGMDYNTEALRRQEAAAVRALQQVQNLASKLTSSKVSPQVSTEGLDRLRAAYDALVRTMATPINKPLDPVAFQRATLGFKEQVDAINRSMANQTQTSQKAAGDVTAAFNRQMMAAQRAEQQVRSLNDQISRAASASLLKPAAASGFTERANTAGAAFGNTMQTVGLDPRAALQAQLELKRSLTGIQRDMKATAGASRPLQAALSGLADSAGMVIGPMNGVVFRLRASQDMMSRYGIVVGATAAALSGFAVAAIGLSTEMIRVTVAYQKSEVMLTGLLRSTQAASGELDWLRAVAYKAGLDFSFLAPQFAQFVAAAQGSGQSLARTNDQFERMAMIGGTMHMTSDQMNRVLLAFDQMLSAGRILGDDMRQLRNVMPGAFEAASAAAEKMGEKFRDASGKINSSLNPGEFISNFLDQYMILFNIDLAKPINTLQADLVRVKSSWDFFILGISNAIGASEGFQSAFQAVSNILLAMENNMGLVLGVVGALTGALTGLFTIMVIQASFGAILAFWRAMQLVFTAVTSAQAIYAVGTIAQIGVTGTATAATSGLTVAMHALNAAMLGNPIGIILKGLALLAGTILGGVFAYKAMTQAVQSNNAALAQTDSIESYINAQARLGFQVKTTTAEYIKQARIINQSNRQNLESLLERHRQHLQIPVSAGGSVGRFGLNPDGSSAAVGTGGPRRSGLEDELIAATAQTNRDRINLEKLWELYNTTPELDTPSQQLGNTGADSGRQADADRGLRQLNDIISRAKMADTLLANMWRGPTHSGLVDAISEVNRRLFDMDTDQLAKLNELLGEAGVPVEALGGVANALTVVTLRTQDAEDTVKRFNKVWGDLQKGREELEGINREMQYLVSGGDPDRMYIVEAMNKARDTIRELTTQDLPTLRATLTGLGSFNSTAIDSIIGAYESSNAQGLAALKNALQEAGYEGATAEEALIGFYETIGRGNSQLDAARSFFGDFNEQVKDFHNTLERISVAQSGASLDQLLSLDYLQQAARATEYLGSDALAGLERQLQALGMAGDGVNEMLANFYRAQAEATTQADLYSAILEQQAEAWASFGTNSIDSMYAVLTGAEDLKTGVLNILADLAQTVLNAAIFDPLKTQLAAVITDMVNGKEGVGFGDIAAVFGRAGNRFLGGGGTANGGDRPEGASNAVDALKLFNDAVASGADTLNLDFLTSLFSATAGATAEASATSVNVLATNAATSALIAFTAALTTASASAGAEASGNIIATVASAVMGSPTGAPVPAAAVALTGGGKVSPAMGGFTPGGPEKSGLTNSLGSSKIVDARTTLVINGNVGNEQVERLQAMLDERDARLRNEIPYLIDERVVDSRLRGRI